MVGAVERAYRAAVERYGPSTESCLVALLCLVLFQILTILASRGDVTFLGNLYAFGVIWSFSMKGIAVLVLRYTHPQDREYRVPLNPVIFGVEIPIGLGLITLVLFAIAIINLFTKPDATVAGLTFSALLFTVFEISEKRMHKRQAGAAHVELDQFNLAQEAELNPTNVGVGPADRAPVSTYYALYHLEAVLRRVRSTDTDIVVLHVRMLRRAASGEYDLAPDQLFSTIEQLLFTKVLAIAEKEGKPVRLSVAAANDLWEGILRTAMNLQSATIAAGSSSKMTVAEQAREVARGSACRSRGRALPSISSRRQARNKSSISVRTLPVSRPRK